jgi:DNA ligase-1
VRRFAELYDRLDMTTSTNAKVEHLVDYFEEAPREDAAWAVHFLCGRSFERPVTTTQLREWTYDLADIPEWLFEECYITVGDLAETIALVLEGRMKAADDDDLQLHEWVERLRELRRMSERRQRESITTWWRQLDTRGIFLLNKLLMGAMRVGVSSGLVTKALSELSGLERPTIQHRLTGNWRPSADAFEQLVSDDTADVDQSRPYPYFLASPLQEDPDTLGDVDEWYAEWKWDGIRGQLIKRVGEVFLWSRGQELITDTFPELRDAGSMLPDGVVIDGEILAWRDGQPLPFSQLQKRIGRKNPSTAILREVPVSFLGYDLLEVDGEDIRDRPIEDRRRELAAFFSDTHERFRLSEPIDADSWEELAEMRDGARDHNVEGLMLKRHGSPYRTGRKRGDWWKWKVEPYTIDAVMLYAQASHGRRANLYADLTFGVWDREGLRAEPGDLVPIGKAYSGLTDDEIAELDDWVKSNTIETFGPVRSVPPEQVFELAFAGLAPSNRHKSGIALRFPRIKRWRHDKSADDANTLSDVQRLLEDHHGTVEADDSEPDPEQQTLFDA